MHLGRTTGFVNVKRPVDGDRGSPSPPGTNKSRKGGKSNKSKRGAAAAKAAAKAKAELEEAERLARTREYTVIFRAIEAHGVPNADAKSLSDAYVTFSLLECAELTTAPTTR